MERKLIVFIILAAAGVGLVIFGVLFLSPKNQTNSNDKSVDKTRNVVIPQILTVTPKDNSKNIGPVPDIKVEFEKIAFGGKVKLESSPEMEFSVKNSSVTVYTFTPKEALNPNQQYTFRAVIDGYSRSTWSFQTRSFSVPVGYADKVNKLKEEIPFKSKNFQVTLNSELDRYYIYLDQRTFAQAKNDVLLWFDSKGVGDTSPLDIVWVPKKTGF